MQSLLEENRFCSISSGRSIRMIDNPNVGQIREGKKEEHVSNDRTLVSSCLTFFYQLTTVSRRCFPTSVEENVGKLDEICTRRTKESAGMIFKGI